MITRRGLITGLFAAPAIIAIDRLMPVRAERKIVAYSHDLKAIYTRLSQLKNLKRLYDYQVVCDQSNNTPCDIEQSILNVDVFIKINPGPTMVTFRPVNSDEFQQALKELRLGDVA